MFGKQKQMGRWIAIAVAIGMVCASHVAAQKKVKPPDDGDSSSTIGDTIYYRCAPFYGANGLNSMRSDGRAKKSLPSNVNGDPSRLLHGGFRWFVQLRFTDRYNDFYPDGTSRRELFAVREDGNEEFTVQLTDDATLQFCGTYGADDNVRWAPTEDADSGLIAALARRWELVGSEEVGLEWQVVPESFGVYTATVVFDSDGNAAGLWEGAPDFCVDLPGKTHTWSPDFDWSPDLSHIVYSAVETSGAITELRIVDVLTGEFATISTASGGTSDPQRRAPAWSPDGSVIAFSDGFGAIYIIRPDGTKQKKIIDWIPGQGYRSAHWSPAGTHLVCWCDVWSTGEHDVYRFNANGGGKTNLTKDIPENAKPVAWR